MPIREKIMVVLSGAILISLMTSCRQSPVTVTATATALPTNTSVPLSLTVSTNTTTAVPTTKRTPTSTPTLLNIGGLIVGTPVPVWKDIPVMPGAIAGNVNGNNYLYTTAAKQSEVANFYIQQLVKLGWKSQPKNGTPEASSHIITLVFSKAKEDCIISIIPEKVGVLVMLGNQAK